MSDLKQAIRLIKSGEKQKAGQILARMLKSNPENEKAWLWMSQAVKTRKEQRQCLNQVLKINPDNELAHKALAKLDQKSKARAKQREPQAALGVAGSSSNPPIPTLSEPVFFDGPQPRQSSLSLGCIGGLLATGLGAGIWAILSVISNYQIGWMAVGVGFLVGIMVNIFGRGDSPFFGFMGAALAFIGCLLGNYLVVGVLASRELGLPSAELVLDFNLMIVLMQEFFSPIDVLFYLIAIYQGFRFSYSS